MKQKPIPEEDLKAINDSFKETGEVATLQKNAHGQIVEAKKQVVNEKSIIIQDFSGRVLRHQKSIVILGTGQLIIGVRGQNYDDIAPADRQLVVWSEDDFEPKNGG